MSEINFSKLFGCLLFGFGLVTTQLAMLDLQSSGIFWVGLTLISFGSIFISKEK